MKLLRPLVAVAACLTLASAAQATPIIIGGSALLTPGSASQLETWLGEGPLTLTNIFTKTTGSTAADFHAAADGQGRTFSIMEVTGLLDMGSVPVPGTFIIGGYNPQSWSSIGDYNYSPPSPTDAFLFNLTSGSLLPQRTDGSYGVYQTYNWGPYGPTFGGGHDLFSGDLYTGYAFAYSYTTTPFVGPNVFGGTYHTFNIDRVEVFTISNSVEAVPEPTTLALLGAGLVAVRARRRRTS